MAGNQPSAGVDAAKVKRQAEEPVIERMANAILVTGIERRACDISLRPDSHDTQVSFSVDGAMSPLMKIPKHIHATLVARYKIMANLALDQQRIPQIGHTPIKHGDRQYNIRVSTLPTLYGEAVALHVLDVTEIPDLSALGMGLEGREALSRIANFPSGLLLLAGSHGMGLTTTAAALINQMDTEKRCIGSCEEVHEYPFDGVMQTYQRSNQTVADNIHALVAQHADVIFVGDIHFAESARVAVDAALSGVLTIATIPALDAIDALRRLIGFGIDPRLAARALSGVCAQRLVHRICESCRTDDVRTANDLWAFGYRADDLAQPVTLRRGTGCEACGGKGYRGRIGIFEVLAFDDTLARLLAAGAPDDKLRDASRSTDRIGMREDALRKIMAGIISLDDAQYALHRVP